MLTMPVKQKTHSPEESASNLVYAMKDAVGLTLNERLKDVGDLSWRDIEGLTIDVTNDAVTAIAGTFTRTSYNLVAAVDPDTAAISNIPITPNGQVVTSEDLKKAMAKIDDVFNEVNNDD